MAYAAGLAVSIINPFQRYFGEGDQNSENGPPSMNTIPRVPLRSQFTAGSRIAIRTVTKPAFKLLGLDQRGVHPFRRCLDEHSLLDEPPALMGCASHIELTIPQLT
jgi:hypothetical protein